MKNFILKDNEYVGWNILINKQTSKYLLLIISILMISACGFQLRGTGTHSLSGTYIYLTQNEELDTDNDFQDFDKEFKRELKQVNVELVSSSTLEKIDIVELNVVNLEFLSQGVSRDATGRANEHEVTLRIDYRLPSQRFNQAKDVNDTQDKDALSAEPIIHSLSVAATYYQDYRNPTAGRVQKTDTYKLLISQLTQRLIRQLEFKLKNK